KAGDLVQQLVPRTGMEWPPPREDLIENYAQAKNVTAPINPMPFAASLLGTHVSGGARQPRPAADGCFPERQSEISDIRLAGGVQQDVAWLDVAVDQPLAMGVVERVGQRRDQTGCFRGGGPITLDLL